MRPKDVTMRLPFIRILLTYCASTVVGKSNQGKRKRLITCGAPYASSGFIYTHPVNSSASELGWSPDHYLTIHSAVSQPYLKELPSPNLRRRSRSFVGSQTLKKGLGRRLYGCIPTTNLFYKYKRLRRRSAKRKKKGEKEKLLQQGDQQSRKCLYSGTFEKWLIAWRMYRSCECTRHLYVWMSWSHRLKEHF